MLALSSWVLPARADTGTDPAPQSTDTSQTPTTTGDSSQPPGSGSSDPQQGSTTTTPDSNGGNPTADTNPQPDPTPTPAPDPGPTGSATPPPTTGSEQSQPISAADTSGDGQTADGSGDKDKKPVATKGGGTSDGTTSTTDVTVPVTAPPGTGGLSPTATTTTGEQTGDVWSEQWTYDTPQGLAGMRTNGARSMAFRRSGVLGLFRATQETRLEARARQKGDTPKASPLPPGLVLPGAPAPGSGLFDLLSGSGGGGAMLTFFGLLGILAVTLLRIPGHSRAFQLPAVSWRPSEYVPPIESPG